MTVTTPTTRLPRVLQPFALRQYRWLVAGLALALFGDGVWLIALIWQVIALGGGPGAVSLASGIAAVGMVASTLLGGVLADRASQRSIIIGLETVKLLAFASVGIAALLHLLTLPHLVVAALLVGITTGMYYPAYSALLPRVVDAAQLLAANGVEGFLRPVLLQAAGPLIAGVIVGAASPGTAILVGALACVLAAACYVAMGPIVDDVTDSDAVAQSEHPAPHPIASIVADLGEGFAYMWRTPWLWASLFYFSFLLLMVMGPLEVLVPFALRERVAGGAADHAMVLAAFGAGAALGAFVLASRPMPRRYLSLIFGLWAVAALPLVVMGVTHSTFWFVVAGFGLGLLLDGPMVLWGTLLQRRVPTPLLGRISGLDFFVSAALMPVSMAVVAPISGVLGVTATFVLAGLLPVPAAVLFYVWARLWRDEIDHPLQISELDVPLPPSTPR
ncbi:MFS transporter [Gordonia alkaliphila]|uniref:MFS transporter n=1 Tax=Gordonia alkaliphila TaxID=1053547 RepID=UPI003557A7CF